MQRRNGPAWAIRGNDQWPFATGTTTPSPRSTVLRPAPRATRSGAKKYQDGKDVTEGGKIAAPARSHPISGKEIDMLVLTRHVGESIRINDNVTVRIMAAIGDKAVLGIAAPKAIRLRKGEAPIPPST